MSRRRSVKQRLATKRFLNRSSLNSARKRRALSALRKGPPELSYAVLSFIIPGLGQLFQKKYGRAAIFFALWLLCIPFVLIIIGDFFLIGLGLISMFEVLLNEDKSNNIDGKDQFESKPNESKADKVWESWIEQDSKKNDNGILSDELVEANRNTQKCDAIWDSWILEAQQQDKSTENNENASR